jgi:hypothetical protein
MRFFRVGGGDVDKGQHQDYGLEKRCTWASGQPIARIGSDGVADCRRHCDRVGYGKEIHHCLEKCD